jgi:hypothetical protein
MKQLLMFLVVSCCWAEVPFRFAYQHFNTFLNYAGRYVFDNSNGIDGRLFPQAPKKWRHRTNKNFVPRELYQNNLHLENYCIDGDLDPTFEYDISREVNVIRIFHRHGVPINAEAILITSDFYQEYFLILKDRVYTNKCIYAHGNFEFMLKSTIDLKSLKPPKNSRKKGFYKVVYGDGKQQQVYFLNHLCLPDDGLEFIAKFDNKEWLKEFKEDKEYAATLRKTFLDDFNQSIHSDMREYYEHIRMMVILFGSSDITRHYNPDRPTGGYYLEDIADFAARYYENGNLAVKKLRKDFNDKCKSPLGETLPMLRNTKYWDCAE